MIKILFLNKTENVKIQLFRSLFVGGVASVLDIISFIFFAEVLNIHYLVANLFSFTIGLISAYILTIQLVFTSASKKTRSVEFFQFFLVAFVGLLISQIVLWICIDIFSLYVLFSKIIATLVAFIWNFLARKYFVFKIDNSE